MVVDLPELWKKKPPSSIEAEMSLLGSILLDVSVLDAVTVEVPNSKAFYSDLHQVIYAAILERMDAAQSLDLVQLVEVLRAKKVFDERPNSELDPAEPQVLNAEYLVKLAESVPSAANAVHYAKIVATHARARGMAEAGAKMVHAAYHLDTIEPEAVYRALDESTSQLFALAERRDETAVLPLKDLIQIEMDLQDQEEKPRGVQTGLAELQHATNGLHPGEMTIIAARPSVGKTALGMTIAYAAATAIEKVVGGEDRPAGTPVGVFSMEMSRMELVRRLLVMETGLDMKYFRGGNRIPQHEYRHFLAACDRLSRVPIFVDDTPGLSIAQLRTRARKMAMQYGLGLIVIDYVQLMYAPGRDENRQTEVAEISRGIKSLARELKVPVLALCQLNRLAEGRHDGRPRMSDLRESGALEQDADNVWLIHREDQLHKHDDQWKLDNPHKVNQAQILIEKQRQGAQCSVELAFQPAKTKFIDGPNIYNTRAES